MSEHGSAITTSAPALAQKFLHFLFGPDWQRAHVCVVPGDPGKIENAGWGGGPAYRHISKMSHLTNNYFAVSLFTGQLRRIVEFEKLVCLAVDDVGPKIDAALVELLLGAPSWVVETSPKNFQWGYRLQTPITDAGMGKELIHRIRVTLTGHGAKDPGQEGVTRYMRLPCGSNLKGSVGSWRVVPRFASKHLVTEDHIRRLLKTGQSGTTNSPGALPTASSSSSSSSVLDQSKTGELLEKIPTAGAVHGDEPLCDALLDAFRKLGLVLDGPRDTAMGRGYDVRCPWVDEHTDRAESGTVYVPGAGKFKCQHGHCDGRDVGDVREKLDEMLREAGHKLGLIGEEFDVVDPATVPMGPAQTNTHEGPFFARYVLMLGRNRFFDLDVDHEVTAMDVDTNWTKKLNGVLPRVRAPGAKHPKIVPPSRWFMEQERGRRVADMMGWPGKPRIFVPDPQRPLRLCVNTWKELERPLKTAAAQEVDVRAIAPWLEVFWHVIGWDNEQQMRIGEVVLDWLSLLIGDPSTKAGWHVVLMGQQGIGKDMIMQPLANALGRWAQIIQSQQIGADFNEWQSLRLVQINETKQNTRGALTSHDQMNVLKSVFDNTRQWIVVNPKYAPKYETRNVVMGWFTSNEREPLRIEPGDRRFLILDRSEAVPLSPGHYDKLQRWLGGAASGGSMSVSGAARVIEFLFRRWEQMPRDRREVLMGNAPDTPDKQALMGRLMDPVEEWIRRTSDLPVTDALSFPDIVTVAYVHNRLFTAIRTGGEGLPGGVPVPSLHKVADHMLKAGTVRLNDGKQVRVGSAQLVLWAARNGEAYKTWPPSGLASLYANAIGGTTLH